MGKSANVPGALSLTVVLELVMRRAYLLIICVLPLWLLAEEKPSVPEREYFGTYLFEDGVRVSGGRFDEAGNEMLLYIDTAKVSRGSTLKPSGRSFVPAFGFGNVKRVMLSDDGDRMHWELPSGEVLDARRVMQPEFLSAKFRNGNVMLHGTLYLPPHVDGATPGIVLAHGSGPASRYAGTWITFFLEQGFAVLSYDKRGVGMSGGDWRTSTYLDLAGDLSTAVDWMRAQPAVDADRVGIHTSSQSGWYGPRSVKLSGSVAFLIQRAGPAVDIAFGTVHERREEWRAKGVPEDFIEAASTFWLQLHTLASQQASLASANALLDGARKATWFGPTFGEWKTITAGWWRRHVANMRLEPAAEAAMLRIPVLWFLAEKDQNVPFDQSRAALEDAQKKNPQLRIVSVRNAPHSFLIEKADGRLHYTDRYWTIMAQWLHTIALVPHNT